MEAETIRLCAGDATYDWVVRDEGTNPWDFGEKENVRMLLGPYWSWLFFWIATPLMKLPEFPNRLQVVDGEIPLTPLPPYRSWFARFLKWYRPWGALRALWTRVRSAAALGPDSVAEGSCDLTFLGRRGDRDGGTSSQASRCAFRSFGRTFANPTRRNAYQSLTHSRPGTTFNPSWLSRESDL
jgi:hypothetical protein